MKTTVELPDDLMRRVKHHALERNLKLKDAVESLLLIGLSGAERQPARFSVDPVTGLTVIQADGNRGQIGLAADEMDRILAEQETEWHL